MVVAQLAQKVTMNSWTGLSRLRDSAHSDWSSFVQCQYHVEYRKSLAYKFPPVIGLSTSKPKIHPAMSSFPRIIIPPQAFLVLNISTNTAIARFKSVFFIPVISPHECKPLHL